MPVFVNAPVVYVAYDGTAGRAAAFPDLHALRAAGIRVEYSLKDLAFGKQLKAALESGAKLALLYGGDELARGVVKLRNLTERTEHEVPSGQVVTAVRDFLDGK
jgi:histidyl-tRNA synthetase